MNDDLIYHSMELGGCKSVDVAVLTTFLDLADISSQCITHDE